MNTPFVPSCLRANHFSDDRIMGEPEHMLVFEPPSTYSVLPAREDLHTEFKEACSGLPENLCDTLCAFLNTDGGTLYLGVGDKGEVLGLEPDQIERYAKDIASISNNPQKIDPPYLLFPKEEIIGDKRILVIQVPLSSQLHRHKGEIYLRSDEGDYRVKGSHQLAGLLNRKLGIFTEQTPMPHFSLKDLRPDLFERARTLMRRRNQNHPWLNLDMDALLRTAGLYTPSDPPSSTLTLAAILLFGTDVAIRQAAPAYTFDCLLRRRDVERYDDRLMIDTNLIDAYDLMMGFVEKHLNDPFYLEHDASISLRERIFREAISNIIAHREYRDATPARLMIYKDRVVLDNPAMAYFHTRITPRNLRSHPKNPAICKFMIQIARFDQLGSGVLNIHKYWPIYSTGAEPVFRETRHGFELILPLPGAPTTEAKPVQVTAPVEAPVEAPVGRLESRLESRTPRNPEVAGQVTGQVSPQVGAQVGAQVGEQVTPEVTPEVRRLLPLCVAPKTRRELQVALGLKDDDHIRVAYIDPALAAGLIERTLPDKPNSRLQKYRLTEKGRVMAGGGKAQA